MTEQGVVTYYVPGMATISDPEGYDMTATNGCLSLVVELDGDAGDVIRQCEDLVTAGTAWPAGEAIHRLSTALAPHTKRSRLRRLRAAWTSPKEVWK